MLYLTSNGEVYGGDRQARSDGTLDPPLPDRPSPQHQWNGSAWVLVLAADWDTFRTAMMGDSAYQKMAIGVMSNAQGSWLMTTLQDAITMPAPSIALVQPLWNQIIQLTPLKPTSADVVRWQSNADSNHVGITFLASGAIDH